MVCFILTVEPVVGVLIGVQAPLGHKQDGTARVVERVFTNRGRRGGHARHACQVLGTIKRFMADVTHHVADFDASQTRIRKGPVLDDVHRIGNDEVIQTRATPKRIYTDAFYGTRDVNTR